MIDACIQDDSHHVLAITFFWAGLVLASRSVSTPVASNDDEAGRAKNRRVVLVKLN
ncbi:hypothetical protein BPNPMPFG_003154 [Mesorhizobium sp. AR07]|uniref:hypothetical protein n=1 Tax=Mesorhizobium sp. AR07 TaxID=2865838 RepID=UPI00215E44AB|nr:hypothetical protein [Mesorhizobium sp. AR07]UVK47382.1 hypothetical protein BPNPMPFG_003154 [Mesorhizobium sp. AR07]